MALLQDVSVTYISDHLLKDLQYEYRSCFAEVISLLRAEKHRRPHSFYQEILGLDPRRLETSLVE